MKMPNENEKCETRTGVVGLVDNLVIWFGGQWKKSLAKSIWDDLTVLGRFTLWFPIWLLCWLSLPVLLPVCAFAFLVGKIGNKPFGWLNRQFFK
jgi:hypothetical protein